MATTSPWPNGARTAISLTLDNMGEAADLNRGVWPDNEPVGSHYSVVEALPKVLAILASYDIKVTYFIESWNLNQYPDAIVNQVAAAGHEIGWHAFQHEAWYAQLKDEEAERDNFERSFSAMSHYTSKGGRGEGKVGQYRGFRPPGGPIHGQRTLKMCREYGLQYISPAAEHAAVVDLPENDSIVVLPYRWRTVDAFHYMEAFGKLRLMKGESSSEPHSEDEVARSFLAEIDDAIESATFVAFLFHPFLTNSEQRLAALEKVAAYLAKKRNEGVIWLARCCDVADYVQHHREAVATDPEWDQSSWR